MDEHVSLVPIKFEKVVAAKNYTCVVMGSDEKKFAIYTSPSHGKLLQKYLTNTQAKRPMTHDLIQAIFQGLDISLKQIVIYGYDTSVFDARLFIEQNTGDLTNIVEIDARPSDCIALAMTKKVPLYCTKEVFDNAVSYVE